MAGEFSWYWFATGMIMLIPHFVCSILLEKRRFFAVREAVGLVLYCICAYLACFTDQWHERYYLLLHLAGALFLALCSRCSLKMIVYFNIWSITLYYLVFQIYAFINALTGMGDNNSFQYLMKALSAAALAALTLWIVRSLKARDVYNLPASQVLISGLISAAIIAINTITFSVIIDEAGLAKYMFQVFSMLCTVLALYIQVTSFYSQRKASETEYIKHMWRASKKDYELKAEYIDLINRKYHDLKHELRALRQLDPEDRNQQIDRIEQAVDQFSNMYQTGNASLDAILNEERRRCEKEKIMFSCVANCGNIDFIDVVDMNILLGNMLDNAIEAAAGLPQENRVVDVKIRTDEHFLRITERNTFSGELWRTEDGLASTKPDKGYHGFGSRSMKYIVDRYNGQMAVDVQDNVFMLHVMIPIPES